MSRPIENLIGKTFGKLLVLGKTERPHHWLTKCECGVEKVMSGTKIRKLKHCGCSYGETYWRLTSVNEKPTTSRESRQWAMNRLRLIDEARAKGVKLAD